MSGTERLKRALVVISPDLIDPNSPRESRLISRAIELARANDYELELFHVCHEPSLEQGLFRTDPAVIAEKKRITDRETALLAEIVVRLKSEGVTVHHDVRWDHPRTDAILRKIEDVQPDIVVKESREHDFVIGLTRNTDWDLIRQSPADVWFVSGRRSAITTIATAVGMTSDNDEPFSHADYDIFRTAQRFAKSFGAENHPVHCYQVPAGMGLYAAYAPDMVTAISAPLQNARFERDCKEIATVHGHSIRAFAESIGADTDNIHIVEGHPSEAIPVVAQELDADLVIMGARSLSRWERIVSPVTAEPVLAEGFCDILFVKEESEAIIPAPAERPIRGNAPADLESVRNDPDACYGSPLAIVADNQVSESMRQLRT